MVDFLAPVTRLAANLIRCGTGAFGSEPSNPLAGDLYLPNDAVSLERYSGSAWGNWGPIFPLTKPDAVANWTWNNQGSATAVDEKGTIILTVPAGAGNNLRGLYKTAPATPWTVTACFQMTFPMVASCSAGLFFRQSDGKMAVWVIGTSATQTFLLAGKYTSATVYSANYTTFIPIGFGSQPVWLRISDNGTNRICSWSPNGLDWVDLHTIGRTDFMTATQYGFHCESANATYGPKSRLLSLVVS